METVRTERNASRTKENNRFGGYFERRIHSIPHDRRAAANAIRALSRVYDRITRPGPYAPPRRWGTFAPPPPSPPQDSLRRRRRRECVELDRRRPPADGSLLQSVFEYHRSRAFEFSEISLIDKFIIYKRRNYKYYNILLKTPVRKREFCVNHPCL